MRLEDIKKAHFIGIGGIGMSALARLFIHEKKIVSGSDRAPSPITEALIKEGVTFFPSQTKENITEDIDLVIYTEAMPKDHEELVDAKEKDIPTMNYFEALGMVVNQYYLIAVSGAHGKTTTTAMLTDIFENAGADPTAIIGSLRSKTKSNFRAGKSKYAIVEACEYRRDFLSLEPTILVITNIEPEHLDYYKDLADIQSAFRELAVKVPEDGMVIANLSDENVLPVVKGLTCKVVDYSEFFDFKLSLHVPGVHNRMNAAAATAVADQLGFKPNETDQSLVDFAGTWRRFEYKGEINGAKVYDDYGHHPSEIRATLQGTRELYPDRKIILVYQPHLDKRTETLFDDFVLELGKADRLILTPAYVARDVGGGEHNSTKRLYEVIHKTHSQAEYIEELPDIIPHVKSIATENDVVLIMGAGDITMIATELVL